MMLQAFFGRRLLYGLGLAAAAAVGYLCGSTTGTITAQQPGSGPTMDRRIVAYIYNNVPIYRDELGDFLIARGGYEKLDLLVNKRIIEIEAARRKIYVTSVEVESALNDDLKGMGITLESFEKHVLSRYKKTLYEWTEDVIKPRLLLGKMVHDRIKITEADLKRVYDNRYGEKRQAQIICWNKEDLKAAEKQWGEARKSDTDFDRVARAQADPSLASSAGKVAPIGQFPDVEDEVATKRLFALRVGEMTELFQTPAGIMCIKCIAVIPPDTSIDFNKVRTGIEREVYDRKLSAEIPKFFEELKKVAQPNLLLKGPPTEKEFRDGVKEGVREVLQTGGVPPQPQPQPMPKR
jgi:hypothetical protein